MRSVFRHTGGAKELWEPLSFVPSLAYWILLCDENYMLAGVVALAGVLLAFQGGMSIRMRPLRLAYCLLLIPALYVLAGGAVLVFALLCIVSETGKGGLRAGQGGSFIAGCGLLLLLSPLLSRYAFPQYPAAGLWTGGAYYRFPGIFPFLLLLLWLSAPGLALLYKYLPAGRGGKRKSPAPLLLQAAALALMTAAGISRAADWKKEEVMRYDALAGAGQWERILPWPTGRRRTPRSPLPS